MLSLWLVVGLCRRTPLHSFGKGGERLFMAKFKLAVFFALILLFSVPAALVQADGHAGNVKGTAVVSDGNTLGDVLTVTLEGLSQPAEGSYLVAWLISDDESVKANVGALTVALDGSVSHTYVSSTGENLLASYGGFAITVESAPDVTDPSAEVPYIGYFAGEGNLALARMLVVEAEGGSVAKLRAQVMAALEAAEKARAAGSTEDLNTYAQMAIDIIDDGVLTEAETASAALAEYEGAGAVATAVNNVSEWATEAKASAETAMGASDLQVAKSVMSSVTGQLGSALNGVSATGLGGANQAYAAAQGLATFSVETPRPPEPTPTPEPTPVLPPVGEPAASMLGQMALIAAIALLAGGSAVVVAQVIRGRRG